MTDLRFRFTLFKVFYKTHRIPIDDGNFELVFFFKNLIESQRSMREIDQKITNYVFELKDFYFSFDKLKDLKVRGKEWRMVQCK